MKTLFADRVGAAAYLVPALANYKARADVVVLGLPRGGMILADHIARTLELPLDFIAVKKIGAPSNEKLALGAVTEDGMSYFDWVLIGDIEAANGYVDAMTEKKKQEAHARATRYLALTPHQDLHKKIAIIVDDGIATGATMRAAVNAARTRGAAKIVVAVPVAARESADAVRGEVEEFICPHLEESFGAVGEWYHTFPEVRDEEVEDLLRRTSSQHKSGTL